MNILEKMDLSEDPSDFYVLDDENQQLQINEILDFANNNFATLKDYCNNVKPSQFINLNIIYIALATQPEKWGDFLFDEFKRMFELAKTKKETFKYLECLDFPFNFENRHYQFIDNIIRFLGTQLDSPIDAVRYEALFFLDIWIEEEEFFTYKNIIEQMAKKQNDKNWKIRNLTFGIFTGRPLLPNVEFKLNFMDKLRVNGFLFSSDPYKL